MKIGNICDYYPLTPMQEGIYYQSGSSAGNGLYCEQLQIRLAGSISEGQLTAAWQQLLNRYDCLRTIIVEEGLERPVQVVLDELTGAECKLIEPDCDSELFLESFAAEEMERGFKPDKGLCRLYGINLAENSFTLIFTFHHIIMDGWSAAAVMNEFFTLLEGECGDLPRVTPFSSYVEWLYKKDDAPARAFWKRYLLDYSRPPALPGGGAEGKARITTSLDSELSGRLKELSRRLRCSLSSLFQLVWGLILQRYTGSNDIVFGLVQSQRPAELEGAAGIAGLCINTVPCRIVDLSGLTVGEAAASIFSDTLKSYSHNHLPLKDIMAQSELGAELFNTVLTFHNFSGLSSTENYRVTGYKLIEQTEYEIALSIDPAEEIGITAVYEQSRVSSPLMEQILGHFAELAEQLSLAPEKPLSTLTLVGENHSVPELKGVLGEGVNIYARLREVALTYPEQRAVSYMDESLTYRQFIVEVDRFAAAFMRRGVREGDVTALMFEPGLDMVITIYALLKLGSPYLPLDPASPSKQLDYMLSDSGAKTVVTTYELSSLLESSLPLYKTEDLGAEPAAHCDRESPASPQSAAYIIYTSGSTGRPKGVVVTHNNLAGIALYPNYITINRGDRLLQLSSYSFDGSCFALYGALLQGAELVLIPKRATTDVQQLSTIIIEREIDCFFITTALFNALVELALPTLDGVGKILFGGERASLSHVESAFKRLGPDRLVHCYGPTETTVFASCYSINSLAECCRQIPIGYPIRGRGLYILDSHQNMQPYGAVGELYICGEGVAKGYLNRPELTTERFPENLESAWYESRQPGRLYRTGDLVRYNREGGLEFIGRRDNQIKIRGFRVELGEIESRLAANELVGEALVLVRRSDNGADRILAYVTLKDKEPIEPEKKAFQAQWEAALLSSLRSELPEYMIPSNIMILEEFPVHSRGKVDRAALPLPEELNDSVDDDEEPGHSPANEREERLLVIWQELFKGAKIGVNDSFHSLGGDSILALKLAHQAGRHGFNITADRIMKLRTIRALAALSDEKSEAELEEVDSFQGPFPLTPIQSYFFSRAGREESHFNQALVLALDEPLEPEALEAIWKVITARHQSLRLCFSGSGENRRQEMSSDGGNFVCYGLTSELYDEKFYLPYQKGLDIERGHLINLVHYRVESDSSTRIAIIIHHLAVDGISWQVLLEELGRLIKAYHRGEPLTLGGEEYGYGRWLSLLSADEGGLTLSDSERAFWHKESRERAAGELFPLLPPAEEGEGFAESDIGLKGDEAALLAQSFLYTGSGSLADILLTLYLRTLLDYTGESDLRVDLESHGRGRAEGKVDLALTTGWFTALYPLNFGLSGGSFADSLTEVTGTLRAVPQQGSGYGMLRYLEGDELLKAEPEGSEVSFNYLGNFDLGLSGSEPFRIERLFTEGTRAADFKEPHRLMLDGLIYDDMLKLRFSFDRRYFNAEKIEEFTLLFRVKLEKLLAHCREEARFGQRVAMAPNRHWYFTRTEELERWGPVLLMNISDKSCDAELVGRAIGRLYSESDSLRLRYNRRGGEWREYIAPADIEPPYHIEQLGELEGEELERALEESYSRYQESLRLDGYLCRFVYHELSGDREPILMVMLHHLLIDLYSLQLLLERLNELFEEEVTGTKKHSPKQSGSYSEWCAYLAERSHQAELEVSKTFWQGLPWEQVGLLPVDFADGYENNRIVNTTHCRQRVKSELTAKLYSFDLAAQGVTAVDVIYLALLKGFYRWGGVEALVLEVVSHGRDLAGRGPDISSIIGWFNNFVPYLFCYKKEGRPEEQLREIAALRENYEREGADFGLVKERLSGLPPFEMAFNYVPPGLNVEADRLLHFLQLRGAKELKGDNREGGHIFSSDFGVIEGELTLTLSYSTALHREESALKLAQLVIEELSLAIEKL